MADNITIDENSETNKRRSFIKGMITIPVLVPFGWGIYKKLTDQKPKKETIVEKNQFNLEATEKSLDISIGNDSATRRIGIIGFGQRGEALARSAGFIHPDELEKLKKASKHNSAYRDYITQDGLHIEITGVCDIFEERAKKASEIARPEKVGIGKSIKIYKTYKELIAASNVDAVIIATPDHLHAEIVIEAAKNGKAVYVENCMTRTIDEAFKVREAVKRNNITFQLGHQGRQVQSYLMAEQIINENKLGDVSLIELSNNVNEVGKQWIKNKLASADTVDWPQFVAKDSKDVFSLERFFRWRFWWNYSSGPAGDLFTHEFDAMNKIFKLGIPSSVVASGGVYHFGENREVPDVFQTVLEYPKQKKSVVYSLNLSNDNRRPKIIYGEDAIMELDSKITVNVNANSRQYRSKIENEEIIPNVPILSYNPSDADTENEFLTDTNELKSTYYEGKKLDTARLHIIDWLRAMQSKSQPDCNVDQGFQVAITAHMATLAFRSGRKIEWDSEKEQIKGYNIEEDKFEDEKQVDVVI